MIEDIEAREKAATPGRWLNHEGEFVSQAGSFMAICRVNRPTADDYRAGKTVLAPRGAEQANKEFIAHARSDIPYLLAQLRDRDEKLEAVGRLCPEHPQTKWVGRPCKDDEWWIEELDRILKGGE